MMRARRELETINISVKDSDGDEIFTIESFEDREQTTYYTSIDEKEYVDTVSALMDKIKAEYSLIIKLNLIYYFDLNEKELELISAATNENIIELLKKINLIRKELEEKSRIISEKEAQIGKVYSIKREIGQKLERLKKEEKNGKNVKEEIKEIERKLSKRKAQFEKMIEEKDKGMLIIKTPHKTMAELLKITENAVSIRMHRAEKEIKDLIMKETII
jgi:chromosome segregation ATPase